MKQLIGSLRDGKIALEDVPACRAAQGCVLIASQRTVLSAGTERMLLEFGKAGWINKARQKPDKVGMILEKIRSDGVLGALEAVSAKLDQPLVLGYSNIGVVLECGDGVTRFRSGDRVVSNGPHAEVVRVPVNLCARVPPTVGDDAAAFTAVGAIGLQAIRLVQPTMGESVAVTGLGLIGLIVVQLLRAHGCRVLAIDLDKQKLELARMFGAETVDLSAGEDPVAAAEAFTRGRGVDAVLIAATTNSSKPVHEAALMCRKRGRIILVGVTGLHLSRDDFYKKELNFQVSCSYGPGRHDLEYEEAGHDYPYAYVRWTAQRNFEAVLDMMADGRLIVEPLITHRFPFQRTLDAYKLLESDEFHLGILLEYSPKTSDKELLKQTIRLRRSAPAAVSAKAAAGFIGAGSYASKVLISAFQKAGAELVSIASHGGLSAAHLSRKFEFEQVTTDTGSILSNPAIDTVVIATRHDSHADFVCRALEAGKHVFVEKPLALTVEQLDRIEHTCRALTDPHLVMVGFNRRFAPLATRVCELLKATNGPKSMIYTVNAGKIPTDHWTQDLEKSGGRIVGEVCHFVDLLRFLVGAPAKDVTAVRQSSDTITISIQYEDGSIGTIHYFATGHRSFPKERLEIFAAGRIIILDNFRKLRAYGWPTFKRTSLLRQNKGAREMAAAFVNAVRNGLSSPIPLDELIEVSRTTLQAASL